MRDLRRGVGSVGSCWSHQGHRVAGSMLGSRKTEIYAHKCRFYDAKGGGLRKSGFRSPMLKIPSCSGPLQQVSIVVRVRDRVSFTLIRIP